MIEFHEINVGGSISKNDACLTKLKKETVEIHTHKYKLLATILKWELLWYGNSFGYLVICSYNSIWFVNSVVLSFMLSLL